MSTLHLLIYAATGFFMSILGGISGAGAGFILTPLAILLGLTPGQAVASGKFNGLAITLGALHNLRKHPGNVNRKRIAAIMVLAFAVGLCVPFVIKNLDSQVYQLILGVLLLLMIPVMVFKKIGIKPSQPTLAKKGLGGVLLTISLFLQGAFSGGLGSLVNIVLMGMLGQTANEAHLTKRYSQLVLNTTIILGVIGSNLIVWKVVAASATANLAGGYIGSHMAVKKGDKFALDVMLVMMFVSALFLIIGAY